jgi:hypothetical protein
MHPMLTCNDESMGVTKVYAIVFAPRFCTRQKVKYEDQHKEIIRYSSFAWFGENSSMAIWLHGTGNSLFLASTALKAQKRTQPAV